MPFSKAPSHVPMAHDSGCNLDMQAATVRLPRDTGDTQMTAAVAVNVLGGSPQPPR